MLTIRLQRIGKKNYPTYRFIVSEKARDTQGNALELLGNYEPHQKENAIVVNKERAQYWLSKGAQASNTVHNLFVKAGVIVAKEKKKSVYISKTRSAKIAEENKTNQAAQAAKIAKAEQEAAAAKAAKAEQEAAAAAVPAETVPTEPAATEVTQ